MSILAKYEKQPVEALDYEVNYSEWLASVGDTATGNANLVVTADAGITIGATTLLNGLAKARISGGTDGITYKVTFTVTTAGALVKQAEIKIKVKEI